MPEVASLLNKAQWEPRWRVDVGSGCEVGLTVDDHCYVVLLPHYSTESSEPAGWRPGKWIPRAAALKIAELGESPL
jgi:hypothetical protein